MHTRRKSRLQVDPSYIDPLRSYYPEMAIDPVCGMEVDEGRTSLKSSLDGKDIYFCCANCKSEFDKDPSVFVFDFS